jgi:hypothetical protein
VVDGSDAMRNQAYYATARGERIAYSGALVAEGCTKCGILFAFPEEFKANLLKSKANFYCPNGHSMVFGTSEADRLRDQLKRERAAVTRTQDLYNAEKRSHAATKGQLTKTKKRASAGVCLHCQRTFQNVVRHMATQHAEAVSAE